MQICIPYISYTFLISGTLSYYNSNFSSKLNHSLFSFDMQDKEKTILTLIYINCRILIYTLYLLFISLYNFSFPCFLTCINKDFFFLKYVQKHFCCFTSFKNISLTCNIFSCKAALHSTCQLTLC